jgi:hypothetical protein
MGWRGNVITKDLSTSSPELPQCISPPRSRVHDPTHDNKNLIVPSYYVGEDSHRIHSVLNAYQIFRSELIENTLECEFVLQYIEMRVIKLIPNLPPCLSSPSSDERTVPLINFDNLGALTTSLVYSSAVRSPPIKFSSLNPRQKRFLEGKMKGEVRM